MEACRKIFIELNGINVLLRQTPQKRLWYPKKKKKDHQSFGFTVKLYDSLIELF